MFSPADRDRIRELVLAMSRNDDRITAGALLGSLADGRADEWSDLDLTFAVRDGEALAAVLEDWTARLAREVSAVGLLDLAVGTTVYRVFLLPGSLQLDLSLTPERDFWPRGPSFQLIFGSAGESRFTPPPDANELAGLAVLDVRVIRVAIERGRLWQALYWLDSLRNHVLAIAAVRRGLKASYARATDDLPPDVLEAAARTVAAAPTTDLLLDGLRAGVELLVAEAADDSPIIRAVDADLRELGGLAPAAAGRDAPGPD
jgi:hypothetical protein